MRLSNPVPPLMTTCAEGGGMTPRGRRGHWDFWTARCGHPFLRPRQTYGWRRCSSRNASARRPRRPSPGAHARRTLPPRRSPRSWRSCRERRRALQAHCTVHPVVVQSLVHRPLHCSHMQIVCSIFRTQTYRLSFSACQVTRSQGCLCACRLNTLARCPFTAVAVLCAGGGK